MIKVYATVEVKNNLITTIPFKGMKVRVEFTGGNTMKNIPAKFYTRDPFTQKALDNSDQLGRLFRVHQVIKEDGDDVTGKLAVQEELSKPEEQVPEETIKEPADTVADETADESAGTTADETVDESTGTAAQKPGRLEFANLGEAITYIAAKYGEQVETESQARKFIEEKEGVKPVIHKG